MNDINNTFHSFLRTPSYSNAPAQNLSLKSNNNKEKKSCFTDTVLLTSAGTAAGALAGYAKFKSDISKLKADLTKEVESHRKMLQKTFDNNEMVKMLKKIVSGTPEGLKNTEKNIQELKGYIVESKSKANNGKVKIDKYDVDLEDVINEASKRIKDNELKKELLEKNKIDAEKKLQSFLDKIVIEPIKEFKAQLELGQKQILKKYILKGAGVGLVAGGVISIINYFNKQSKGDN